MKIQFPYQAPEAKEGPCTWHCAPRRAAPRPAPTASPGGCRGPEGPLAPPMNPAAPEKKEEG